jgi:hypothetical protein
LGAGLGLALVAGAVGGCAHQDGSFAAELREQPVVAGAVDLVQPVLEGTGELVKPVIRGAADVAAGVVNLVLLDPGAHSHAAPAKTYEGPSLGLNPGYISFGQ